MKKFYKISREGLEIFIMYDEVSEKCLQVTNNSIVVTKGRFVVWSECTSDEFNAAYSAVAIKIQNVIQ